MRLRKTESKSRERLNADGMRLENRKVFCTDAMKSEKAAKKEDGFGVCESKEARVGSCSEITDFLDEVTEQIEYRPARDPVRREISGHIEDRMEDFISAGYSAEAAAQKAVECMGEPSEIGRRINKVRRPRRDPALFAVILLCVMNGLFISFLSGYRDLNFFSQNFYFLFGILILWFVVKKGCKIVLRYSKAAAIMYFTAFILFILLTRLMHWRYTPVIYNGNFLLPAAAFLFMYEAESKRKAAIAVCGFIFGAVFLQIFFGYLYFTLSGLLLVIMDAAAVCVVLWMRERFSQSFSPRKSLLYVGMILLVLLLSILAIFESARSGKENVFQNFFFPEQSAESVMDDSYNSVLIRSLLERSSWIGPVKLSVEEMQAYRTGEWYFGSGQTVDLPYNEYEAEHVVLEDILPYNFRNNYMLSYLILRCGRMAGIVMSAIICALYVLLLRRVGQIRGRYGYFISVSSFFLLAGQAILYIMGNFG